MRLFLFIAATFAPMSAWAVGDDDTLPPKQTETTEVCANGLVWDIVDSTCLDPDHTPGKLPDDVLYAAVREFAYHGQFDYALKALNAMSDQQDDRVLAYRGFLARKSGAPLKAVAFYQAAITTNPDNLLARSYLGHGLIDAGDPDGALAQLIEIRNRGGRGTWAEISLDRAISNGTGGTGY